MTSEQLQNARAERWRQAANPILTADDARAWTDGIGLCLFLPRRAHFLAPAPSFVEAVAGAPTDAPAKDVLEQAFSLLHRLAADGAVVPLNLFGNAFGVGGGVSVGSSDQPDFVVTREALPYVFSLIGGRNWKSGPGDKASPLMKEIWTLLDHEGALSAQEIQAALGRELTETAVLRAVVELWNGLRVIPVYEADATRWELTQARFADELTASQKVAQATALSALVSLYLDAVIAASSEEVETFLSPLTARSKVREVVNGLQATRQLGLISVGAHPLVHVAGSLPEFAEAEPEAVAGDAAEIEASAEERPRPKFERRPQVGFERRSHLGSERGGEWKHFQKREGGERGERRPFEKRPPFGKKPFDRERGPERREGRSSERKPFERRERGEGRAERGGFGGKRFEKGGKPFGKSFERGKPFGRREDERGEGKKFGGPKRFGEGRESRGAGQERREGEWKPKRAGGGFAKRDFRKTGDREGAKRSFRKPEDRGFERGGKPRFEREGKPRFEREGKARFKSGKPGFGKPGFGKPGFGKSAKFRDGEGRPDKRNKPGERAGKPFGKAERPFGKFDRKPGKPFAKGGKPFGKPARPFGKSQKPFGKQGKSFGKPGGFRPPRRKRKEDGSENAE